MEALKREQLSFIAPLNAFVPIFTLLIAAAFLGEHPPAFGIIGILIIFVGAYIVNLKPGNVRWYEPLRHLVTNTGALLSLAVALGYAINSVLLKQASDLGYDEFTILFITLALCWILLIYVPFAKWAELRGALHSSKAVLAGAAAGSFMGSIFHILALAGTYASYAVSVRRFDTIISVLLGWHHLKESNIRYKLIGSIIMTAGAIAMAIS